MSVVTFERMQDSARLWIYAAERAFTDDEIEMLNKEMFRFLEQWTAHNQDLITSWRLKYARFIMIGVDESLTPASGCSIDSMVRHLSDFEKRIGAHIVNTHTMIFYRDRLGDIQCVARLQFKGLCEEGAVRENSVVFNNTIQSIAELKQGLWEVPMKDSWHYEVFGKAVSV
ncbi:MAG: hypothetical protein ACE5IR_04455 [bacterium]